MNKKNKKLNLLLIALIIIIIFIIIFLLVDTDKYNYSDILLKDFMIEPESKYGKIELNNEYMLSLKVNKINKTKYDNYINKIKELGYTKEVIEDDKSFYGKNEYNFEIKVQYNNRKMIIELKEPLFNIVNHDLAKVIPSIDSSYGTKLIDDGKELSLIVCNIDKTKYKKYVDLSIEKGFNIDLDKQDNTYYALNNENYSLRINYLDKNIMKITLTVPNYNIKVKLNYFISEDTNNPKLKFYIDNEYKDSISLKEIKELDINIYKGEHEFKITKENDESIYYKENINIPVSNEIRLSLKVTPTSIDNDDKLPKVTSIKVTSPQSGQYRYKEVITLRVEFDENIIGTAPELKLSIGTIQVTCTPKEIKDNYIDYTYTVGKTEFGNLEVVSLTGNKLTDLAGNEFEITTQKNTGYNIEILEREKDKGGIYEKSYKTKAGKNIDYYIYIPNIDLVDTYSNLPLVVQMQCCCIDSFKALKNYALLGYLRNGKVKDVPAIVVTPKAYTASPITEFDTTITIEFINAIVKEYNINKKKITISGHSQGARHVLRLVKDNPNYFAGALILSWLESGKERHDMQDKPMPDCPTLFIFEDYHTGDYNYNIAKSLANKYSNIKVQRSKNTEHGTVYKAFYQDDAIGWMLKQERK